jgi:hypothetical protein
MLYTGKQACCAPAATKLAWASDLVSLLSDATVRRTLGQQAAAHIEGCFSWQRLAAIALKAYQP